IRRLKSGKGAPLLTLPPHRTVRAPLGAHGSSEPRCLTRNLLLELVCFTVLLLVAVQVNEHQVVVAIGSPLAPGHFMVNMHFFFIEESALTAWANIALLLSEPSFTGWQVPGFRLGSPLPIIP